VIDTESQDRGRIAELSPTLPMRRAGRPDEVASTVLWLVSDGFLCDRRDPDVSGAR
jgi:NAD(P)-dependent dehydrogenase (short-subunit alcohol dehydrogenase family)